MSESKATPKKLRLKTYIDGFNLYHGLRQRKWRRYYWLNLKRLSELLTPRNHELAEVAYFTARIAGGASKRKRQSTYLEALDVTGGMSITYGHYRMDYDRKCPRCSETIAVPTEKMTDVAIATALLTDAFADKFDTAMLITGDSDLVPAIGAVRRLFRGKKVLVAFPPKRVSKDLIKAASSHLWVNEAKLRSSILPRTITKPNGHVLERPSRWS